jgi:hypothetical protein
LVFRSSVTPRRTELHCLWGHLTNKAHENRSDAAYRIELHGRMIHVLTNEPITPRDVALDRVTFALVRTEPIRPWHFKASDVVRVSGLMAYGVHNRRAGTTLCPIDAFGRVHDELRAPFFKSLQKLLGIAMEPRDGRDFAEFVLNVDAADESMRPGSDVKVQLHHGIQFEIQSRVVDADAFNRLAYAAVGRRRAYGFGAVHVLESYRAEDAPDNGPSVEAVAQS